MSTHDKETAAAAEKYANQRTTRPYPNDEFFMCEDAFLAGDTHGRLAERTRVLELLKNPERISDGDDFGAWIEGKLTKKDSCL